MEQKSQKNGLINLLALVLVGGLAVAVARYGNTLAGMVVTVFLGIGALVSAISWFQMRLEEREHLEKMEFEELTRSASSSALFNTGETEVFPAQRSREQFERFFVPCLSRCCCACCRRAARFCCGAGCENHSGRRLPNPTVPLALFSVFALLLFLLGKYSTSVARINKLRLLRPSASYLLVRLSLRGLWRWASWSFGSVRPGI